MAAAKKDFSNIQTGRVYDTIADATAEPVKKNASRKEDYTEEESQEFLSSMHTTGRKGQKLPRINMAFSPENLDYIRTMASVSGMSITQFVNKLIADNMATNQEIYKKAIEFKNSL